MDLTLDYTKHIQKAEEAARRKNYDFAVELFQQLLEIDPDVGDARAKLRRVLKARHEANKGSKLFRMMKGAAPLAAAKALGKAGKHDAAAKACEKYLASAPLDVEANLFLGIALESAGHFNSALAVFEFVAEIDPRNPEGLKRAGAMMARTGDPLKALEYYERALEADPRDRDALKARKDLAAEAAIVKARYGDVQHSREQMVDQGEAKRLERRNRMHLSEDELAEERERLEAELATTPDDVDLLVELAGVLEKLRDADSALDAMERALHLRPDDTELADRAAGLELKVLKRRIARADKLGDSEEADRLERQLAQREVAAIRSRVDRNPGDAGARLELGRHLLKAGELDQAASELQKAIADPRRADEARFLLAQCFQAKGFSDLARKEFERVLEARPEVDERAREVLYNLGLIAEAEGNPGEARRHYARIYEVDIGFRDVAAKMEALR
ncbi:MAG: tetratricopeptide repeat protein [Planctomycetota bacterium]